MARPDREVPLSACLLDVPWSLQDWTMSFSWLTSGHTCCWEHSHDAAARNASLLHTYWGQGELPGIIGERWRWGTCLRRERTERWPGGIYLPDWRVSVNYRLAQALPSSLYAPPLASCHEPTYLWESRLLLGILTHWQRCEWPYSSPTALWQ